MIVWKTKHTIGEPEILADVTYEEGRKITGAVMVHIAEGMQVVTCKHNVYTFPLDTRLSIQPYSVAPKKREGFL